jgi:hypothetical protein
VLQEVRFIRSKKESCLSAAILNYSEKGQIMKTILFISILMMTACSSNPKLAMHDPNDKLCESHKSDYQYFRTAFDKEHTDNCSGGCAYTPSMNKNSNMMERVAGLYYLMSCDANHGRL